MEYIDFNIVQTGKTLSSDKIIINKYENKISRLFFNFDGTILGRLYFAMLNPITNKYCMKPILNSQVIITTEVSVYPGKWSALLVGVQDDYEIIDNNIDQSKVTFVSNPFNRIIVRDNFLSDSSIEPTVNPAIDEALESLRISQDRLENAAIKATESALLSSENAEKTAQDKAKIEEMVKSVEGIDAQVKLVETYKNDASSSAQQASTVLSSVTKQSEQIANLATKVSEDANTVSGMKSSVETLKNETQNLCKLAEDAKAVAELASTQTSKDKTTIGEWKISIDEIKNQIVIDKAEMDKIKADVNTNKVSSENAAKQTTEDKNAVHLDRVAVETIKQNVEKLGQTIQEATQSGVQMVNQSKQTAVSEITKTGNTHKTAVETAGTTAVQNIGTSKTDALEALETAKTDCTSAINSEGKKQTQAITTEGQKHLTTIQQTAQQAVANVNNAGQTQTERVQSAGNTATESVKTEQGKAKQAVETAKTEAINALQAEGTTQTGNVTAEGTKQVQAVQQAAQEIVADREQIQKNKTDVTALKEDLKELTPRVDNLEKKTEKYSEQFFENFFAMQRTGKKYTVRFPLWETSQVAIGEKLDDNEGLVMEASTLTEKGRDDYSSIPLFKTYDCNVEQFLGKPKITAMRGDKGFDSKEKDTFVLGMSYYHKFWIQDGYMYYSRSDSPYEGYVICSEAKTKNGKRPFCLYAKYVSGTNSKGELGSFYGKNPTRNKISFNTSLSEAKKRGTGYIFGCSADYAYIQNTFMLKYANRNWNTVLGGHFASSGNQFLVSKPETDTKRVVLTKANAEKFPIGSCVSVGDLGQDTNKDRGNVKIHNICDSAKILDIIKVDEANKALVLDIKENITTTATTWVTSMHWKSGFSDSVKGVDGCPCNTKTQISSLLYPTVFQGIELAVGGYEVLGNAFMDISADSLVRDTYVCDNSEKLTNNVTTAKANWKKLLQKLHVEKNNAWCYGTELHMDLESGINVITKAGASGSGSNTGFCDGIYFDTATSTQREFLLLGGLWGVGLGGAFCSDGDCWLGSAWWAFLARLSLSIYRGEFA